MESQRPDGYEELPPVSVTTGLCYFFQVSVVQDPDSHGGDADLVYRHRGLNVLGRADVVAGVRPQHGDIPFVEQR